jgi:hypothetical protein
MHVGLLQATKRTSSTAGFIPSSPLLHEKKDKGMNELETEKAKKKDGIKSQLGAGIMERMLHLSVHASKWHLFFASFIISFF